MRIVMPGVLPGTCRCDFRKGLVVTVLMHARNDQKMLGRSCCEL